MCGIIAYLGSGDTVGVLLEGLKRMEYRGYDSSGMAVIRNDDEGNRKLDSEKRAGKVVNLENASQRLKGVSSSGIAHTRWATHGPPTDRNAHPHLSNDAKLGIVHNGIIENYNSLKSSLQSEGYVFQSDTDTEVLAVLIRHVQIMDPTISLAAAVRIALSQVRGAYGIAVIDESDPDTIIGARLGSPLILGVSSDSLVFASDATAVVGLTDKILYLEDHDLVICTRKDEGYRFSVTNMSPKTEESEESTERKLRGRTVSSHQQELDESIRSLLDTEQISEKVHREMHKLTTNLEAIEKGGYDHFMLKEIMEQPKVLMDCMRGRIDPSTGAISLGGLSELQPTILKARRLIICACGTSWHSGLVGEYLIENLAKLSVEVEYASEFRYRNPLLYEDDIVIAISQSGETADTLEAIRIAKKAGATTMGIVNVVGSSIARLTDAGIYLHVGPEIGVASTKAFTGQICALSMLAIWLGQQRGCLSEVRAQACGLELLGMPEKIRQMLNEKTLEKVKHIASVYRYARNFLYLGRGYNFPVALEGALKLKEISYIHAEGYPAAEMKHGPIALIDEMMPIVVIAQKRAGNDSSENAVLYEKVVSGIEEVIARKGSVIAITDEGNRDLDDKAEFVLETPNCSEYLSPLLTCIHMQLLSYYIAKLRGCHIDQPKNLAKSCTVE